MDLKPRPPKTALYYNIFHIAGHTESTLWIYFYKFLQIAILKSEG